MIRPTFPRLLDIAEREGCDMVQGYRVNRRDSRWKRWQGAIGQLCTQLDYGRPGARYRVLYANRKTPIPLDVSVV